MHMFENYLSMLTLNSTSQYITALGIFVLSMIVIKLFKYLVVSRFKLLAKKTISKFDDEIAEIIDNVHWPFYIVLSLYIAIQFLVLPQIIFDIIYYALMIGIAYYVIMAINRLIDYGSRTLIISSGKKVDNSMITLFSKGIKVLVLMSIIIFIISNIGFDISALVAGLGISGIIIAFALQNVLTDMFAYVTLHIEKPFRPGDFIVIGKERGEVKQIGVKSTRLLL